MFIYCFTAKSRGFYQNFKNEDLCFLNLYSILDLSLEIMLSPPK